MNKSEVHYGSWKLDACWSYLVRINLSWMRIQHLERSTAFVILILIFLMLQFIFIKISLKCSNYKLSVDHFGYCSIPLWMFLKHLNILLFSVTALYSISSPVSSYTCSSPLYPLQSQNKWSLQFFYIWKSRSSKALHIHNFLRVTNHTTYISKGFTLKESEISTLFMHTCWYFILPEIDLHNGEQGKLGFRYTFGKVYFPTKVKFTQFHLHFF